MKAKGPQAFERKVARFVEMPLHWFGFIPSHTETSCHVETTELLRYWESEQDTCDQDGGGSQDGKLAPGG